MVDQEYEKIGVIGILGVMGIGGMLLHQQDIEFLVAGGLLTFLVPGYVAPAVQNMTSKLKSTKKE